MAAQLSSATLDGRRSGYDTRPLTWSGDLLADSAAILPSMTGHEDRRAARLLERMRPYLRRAGHGRLPGWARCRAETEDLVQESLMRAVKHLPRFEGQPVRALRKWLHTVLRNLVTDEKRFVGRTGLGAELPDEPPAKGPSPEAQAMEREQAGMFDAALAQLDPGDRLLLTYRLRRGYAFAELAAALGKPSPDAARMAYTRALRRLRDAVRRQLETTGRG